MFSDLVHTRSSVDLADMSTRVSYHPSKTTLSERDHDPPTTRLYALLVHPKAGLGLVQRVKVALFIPQLQMLDDVRPKQSRSSISTIPIY